MLNEKQLLKLVVDIARSYEGINVESFSDDEQIVPGYLKRAGILELVGPDRYGEHEYKLTAEYEQAYRSP